MPMNSKSQIIPKLRFPEFENSGGWDIVPLNKIAKRTTKKNSKLQFTTVLTNSATQGVVSQEDYFDKEIANQANINGYYIVEKDDFVYNPRISVTAPVGPIKRNNLTDGVMSPLYTIFRFSDGSLDFFEKYFETGLWHNYLKTIANQGARFDRMAISASGFIEMPMPFPKPKEQQKIADCLTSVDELLDAEGQKLDTLKRHKKGLMQQLFPTEGQITPTLRFPEFENSGDWGERQVGDIFKVTRGEVLAMPLVSATKDDKNSYPVYSSQTKNNGLSGYYSEYLYEDAITWTTDGANAGDVNFRKGKFYCTNVCGVLINENGFANEFVAALINSVSRKHVSYVGNPKLMNGVMSKIVIPIPEVTEQQKIANCLSSIDDLITAQNEKITALKNHKKGLLQQLFPSLDEVST